MPKVDRETQIKKLKEEFFDVLVVGGGATGTGVALDARSRGLRVGLVERDDFASGTSSKSTKLIHGGVRYLEQAVLKFDRSQFKLVREALHERTTLLKIAPHLVHPIPILTPLYHWFEIPYYTTGLKLYDRLAGKALLKPSRFVDAKETLCQFPMLKPKRLRGAVIYYDGQFDDARMNVVIAVTASELGAAVANHVEITKLVKAEGKICGAVVRDGLTGETWTIATRVVVNATGPFTDSVRFMDDPKATPMLTASSGTHIILDKRFSPPETGLLIPKTDDGRVLFVLPWLGHTLVGTTDNPAPIEANPKVKAEDIAFILKQLEKYISLKVEAKDILSSWVGLRPLVSDPGASDTAHLSRDHIVNVSRSGLVTVTGGKWTTYRRMASDAVDHAAQVGGLKIPPSQTDKIPLAGGAHYKANGGATLEKEFGIEKESARYLNRAYGDRADRVAQLALEGLGKRLVPDHPYLEAEVAYGAKEEAARSAFDILSRRTRLAFLDHPSAVRAVPRVTELLGKFLGWSAARKKEDSAQTLQRLGA
jgi:glycerol-3-phosphate dehydrogenase